MKKVKNKIFDFYWDYIAIPIIRKPFLKKIRKEFNYSKNYSIISSNCISGEIYHDLDLKFLSPTINVWFTEKDFLKIALNPEYYFKKELNFVYDEQYNYPVGLIDDVKIYFLHYNTEQEARQKWNERCQRLDYNNLYIIMSDLELSDEEFIKFQEIRNCKKKILFTTNPKRADFPDVFYIKKYKPNSYVRKYAVKRANGFIDYELFWDFSKWLSNDSSKNKY